MGRDQYEPRYHTAQTLNTAGGRGAMRVIVTTDGSVVAELVEYFLTPAALVASRSWQEKVVQAVGLLFDYTEAKPPTAEQIVDGTYLTAFVEDMYRGTCGPHGADPLGLYWPAATRTKVLATLKALNRFATFCQTKYGVAHVNPLRPPTFGERVAAARRAERKNANSMFLHLKNARALLTGALDVLPDGSVDDALSDAEEEEEETGGERTDPSSVRWVAGRREHNVRLKRPPALAEDDAVRLFAEGFVVRPGAPGWHAYNVRDLMIAILLRQAGLRVSEVFHLFVRDVMEDPARPGHAKVLLYHPEDGLAEYIDPLTRCRVRTTRASWLQTHWGGRRPRNLMHGSEEYAGWKHLLLDEGAPHWYANVYWVDTGAAFGSATVFWSLWNYYIAHVRPRDTDHPYLFCAHHGETRGLPYKYDAYSERAFPAAVRRAGLSPEKARGTTPHGLRHAYAQDLRRKLAYLPKDEREVMIAYCMHHNSVESQRVYTEAEITDINATLTEASRKLAAGEIEPPSFTTALLDRLPSSIPRL
jgi:hypothetical protein